MRPSATSRIPMTKGGVIAMVSPINLSLNRMVLTADKNVL
jgi:hypothetical protein